VTDLFASGRFVDVILALVAVEWLVLAAYRRRTGRGIAAADLLPNLLAGAFLLLALRAALSGAGRPWITGALLAALCAHFVDLGRRWPKS
jgi:hypothetical protein